MFMAHLLNASAVPGAGDSTMERLGHCSQEIDSLYKGDKHM